MNIFQRDPSSQKLTINIKWKEEARIIKLFSEEPIFGQNLRLGVILKEILKISWLWASCDSNKKNSYKTCVA